MSRLDRPVLLPPNGIPRFYLGGPAIAALRGTAPAGERVPEDWVGSTTTVFGEAELGLARLADGRLVRDAIAADPEAALGPGHVARFGADPALLVKLLDAGERLPVHLHPDAAFAGPALGIRYGKTEAWIVVATAGPDAAVHVGFVEDVAPETLARWVSEQDHDALLGALHRVAVRPGDALFVPAGVAHAIGAGMLIVELQEPTDLSVLLEWDGFGIADEAEATLGLGWERALGCVDLRARDPGALRGPAPAGPVASLLPGAADAFFRAERVAPGEAGGAVELEPGFAILVVTEGAGTLRAGRRDRDDLPVSRGDGVLVPWAAGTCRLEGELVALACRPPVA